MRTCEKAAAEAAQCLLHSGSRRNFRVQPAPGPDNVNWQSVLYRTRESNWRGRGLSTVPAYCASHCASIVCRYALLYLLRLIACTRTLVQYGGEERDASACMRRHQAFVLPPVRERRFRVHQAFALPSVCLL